MKRRQRSATEPYDTAFTRVSNRLSRFISDGTISLRERAVVLDIARDPVLRSLALSVLDSPNVNRAFRQNIMGDVLPTGYNGSLVPVVPGAGGVVGVQDLMPQGVHGTCVILSAAVGSLRYRSNPNGTTSFRFFDIDTRRGEWVTVRNQRDSRGTDGLLGTVEIAYGVWVDRDNLSDRDAWGDVTDGNRMDSVLYAVTGRSATVGSARWEAMESASAAGKTVLVSTDFPIADGHIVGDHAYRVLGVSSSTVTLLNPWLRDGRKLSGADDGIVVLDRATFATEFAQGRLAYA